MTFFDPSVPEEHHCPLPESRAPTYQLRGWICSCGKAYTLEQEHQHGETWLQWRRAPKFDKR